jgi:cell division septation protein DedD
LMNKKIVPWLSVGAIIIALLLLVYFLYYRGGPRPTAPVPGAGPGPTAAGPPAVKPPAAVPAPQEVAPQKPGAALLPGQGAPAPGVAPGAEVTAPGPKVTVLPPQQAQEQYGVLAGKYKKYRSASRLLARLKKHGIPGFIKRKEPGHGPYEVWAGPFATLPEAETAEKSIRAMLKRTPEIHKVVTPVPK